jgi:hypothetical protein
MSHRFSNKSTKRLQIIPNYNFAESGNINALRRKKLEVRFALFPNERLAWLRRE